MIFQELLPVALGVGTVLFVSASIYFAVRFFAYKRRFSLPHRFDFIWVIITFLSIFLVCFSTPPLEGTFNVKSLTWITFFTALLIFYSLIFVLDQFFVEYFLVSVLGVYVSPPLRKVIVMAVFAVAVLVSVQKIFSINPWAIYAPTSLLSLGIGIALKDAFQTFFAGVALSRIIRIGDWVQIGEREGEVMDINWARTILRTWDGDYLFVPNSEFQSGTFANYTYKSGLHRCRLEVGASYNDPPQKVKEVLVRCAYHVEGVLKKPEPEVLLKNYGDSSINYSLTFWVDHYARWRNISADVGTRIWYAFRRENVGIPFPIRTVHLFQEKALEKPTENLSALLEPIDLFRLLSQEEKNFISDRLRKQIFLRGETVVRQGEEGSSFYLVTNGSLEVLRKKSEGEFSRVGELKKGNFFGELSLLTGEPRSATVQAVEDSELLVLEKNDFEEILKRHPALADALAEIVSARKSTHRDEQDKTEAPKMSMEERSAISKKIRNFFNLG